MKTIKFGILATALLAAAQGCSFLDTSLDTKRTGETILTDRNSIWYFANACYSPIINGYSVIDGNLFATASDEAQQTSAASDVIYFNKGIVNASVNPISNLYNNCYEGIRAVNFFLDYIADGKGEEMLARNRNLVTDAVNYKRDLQSLEWYTAEVHILRAYYYAELAKMYGGVPIVESTMDKSGGSFVPRSTYEEVIDYIVGDLAAACAVTQYEICTISGVNDFFVGSGACHTMTVQTEIERVARFYIKGNVSCHFARQIDIGGLAIRIIWNWICSIPRGPCDSFTRAPVVANIGMIFTADGVAVCCIRCQRRCRQQPHHKRGCNRDR